jgi:hypothetical protein
MMRYIYPRDASDVYIGKLVAVVSGHNNKDSSCPVNDSCSVQPWRTWKGGGPLT